MRYDVSDGISPATADSASKQARGLFRRADHLPHLVAIVLTLLAFCAAVRATHDLQWAPEPDLYRDTAAARALLDGRYPEDPIYPDEVWWYNPLLPSLVAAISNATGISLEVLYARAGAYLNLLVPLAFYHMASMLIGAWPAVASLAAFLFFLDPGLASFKHASYSPWLYPYNFVQSLAYWTLATMVWERRSPSTIRTIVLGVLLGVTFLGHTAPGLILATAIVVLGWVDALRCFNLGESPAPALRRVAAVGVVALLVASVFLGPLYARYQMHILNHHPSTHVALTIRELLNDLFSLRTVLTAVGLVAFFRARKRISTERRQVFGAVLVVTCSLLVYGMLGQLLSEHGSAFPLIVPTFHFYLYLTAFAAVLFGEGVRELGELLGPQEVAVSTWRLTGRMLVGIGIAAWVVALLPRYSRWYDLSSMRDSALRVGRNEVATKLYDWFRHRDRGVTLSRGVTSVWIGAAGQPAVTTLATYSNPYVAHDERLRESSVLYREMAHTSSERFEALARKYKLRYVVVEEDMPQPRGECLFEVFRASKLRDADDPDPIEKNGGGPVPMLRSARVFEWREGCRQTGPIQSSLGRL